jgi:hypothetical protein
MAIVMLHICGYRLQVQKSSVGMTFAHDCLVVGLVVVVELLGKNELTKISQ